MRGLDGLLSGEEELRGKCIGFWGIPLSRYFFLAYRRPRGCSMDDRAGCLRCTAVSRADRCRFPTLLSLTCTQWLSAAVEKKEIGSVGRKTGVCAQEWSGKCTGERWGERASDWQRSEWPE